MKRMHMLMLLTLGALSLAGCGGGDDSSVARGNPRTQPPNPTTNPAPTPVTNPSPANDFTAFVKAQIAATSDTTQPVPINSIDFTFADQDNPAAFDDILRPGM